MSKLLFSLLISSYRNVDTLSFYYFLSCISMKYVDTSVFYLVIVLYQFEINIIYYNKTHTNILVGQKNSRET